jgi:hypothetical protein
VDTAVRSRALDPSLLAFLNCHLIGVARWEVLLQLAARFGEWRGVEDLAQLLHRPSPFVGSLLDTLAAENVVERRDTPAGPQYCLDAENPSGRLVGRLVVEVRRSHELRRTVAAQVARSEAAAWRSRGRPCRS